MGFVLRVRGLVKSDCSACDEVRTVTMCQNTSAVIIYANLCFFFSSKEYIILGQVMWIVLVSIGRFGDGFYFESERFSQAMLCSTCNEVRTVTICQNTSAVIISANFCLFFSFKEYMALGQVICIVYVSIGRFGVIYFESERFSEAML